MGLWLDLNWYELSSLGIVRSDKDTALQNWFLSQRSEIVGLNRSGIICTGQCCALGDAGGRQIKPFKRWPSLGESLIEPFFWFGSEREHLLYLQYIYSDSTNKELQRLIICVTHSLSHRPQIAGLSNKPGVPSWWISYRVVLLFMCALCRLFLALFFPTWSAWLGVCTFVMLISGIDAPPRTVGRGGVPRPTSSHKND